MTSPEKNGKKTFERLIWFDYQEQCGQPQVTASAHRGHQRHTEKDEGQKKGSKSNRHRNNQTATNLTNKKPDDSEAVIQEECTNKGHHNTKLTATKPSKRKG